MSQFGNSGYDSAARVNQSAAYLAGATAAPFPPLELLISNVPQQARAMS